MLSVEILSEVFGQWGEIDNTVVMREKLSGLSRGFAFITYLEPSSLDNFLIDPPVITLDGRTLDCKLARPKPKGVTLKLFVSMLKNNVTADDLRGHFSKFGDVVRPNLVFYSLVSTEKPCFVCQVSAVVMADSNTNISRGFGLSLLCLRLSNNVAWFACVVRLCDFF